MTADALANALLPAFRTPLGPLADELRLCDIPRADRLAELGFEYPLTGGDMTNAEVTLGMVGPLLRRHLDPSDPLAEYPDLLDNPALGTQALRGYLTGSIDAVLRIRRDDRPAALPGRGLQDELAGRLRRKLLKVGDYTPARMAAGDDERPLPAASAAVRRGRTPHAALAAARLRSGGVIWAASFTSSYAAWLARKLREWMACRAGCLAGARRHRLSSSSPQLLDGVRAYEHAAPAGRSCCRPRACGPGGLGSARSVQPGWSSQSR